MKQQKRDNKNGIRWRSGIFSSVYRINIEKRSSLFGSAPPQSSTLTCSGIALIGIVALFSILLVGFVSSVTLYILNAGQVEQRERELRQVRSDLDALSESSNRAATLTEEFHDIFNQTIELTNIGTGYRALPSSVAPNSFGTFVNLEAVDAQQFSESRDISYVISSLSDMLGPLSKLQDLLAAQGTLLADIPNLWPIADNHGHVTMEFGPNRHPRSNQWYLHKGIDIAGAYGASVLASANGKVIEAGYNTTGYGHNILIRHKYGFRTRYSHLSRIYVTKGQEVVQGEAIGAVGNSGISTGPHLDFQIILGTDVIDPSLFLKISRRGFARWSGNR